MNASYPEFLNNRKSAIHNSKSCWIFAFALAFLVGAVNAKAQDAKKPPRVGFLTAGSSSTIAARIEALRDGLRELGYVEGKTIIIEWRFGEGKLDRLPTLAAELAALNVEVIVSAGSQVTRPVRDATRKIPIVMAQDTDPLRNGFVVSLARPGGNITGLSSYSAELNGKRVEILKETAPKLSRLAVIGQSTYPGNADALKESETAAGALKLQLEYLDVRAVSDIDSAFLDAAKKHAGGVLVLQSAIINSHRKLLTDRAIKTRLPTIYYAPEFLDSGG